MQSARATSRLRPALGPWAAGAFVVSSMVGTGIFTIPGFVRAASGSAGAALGAWVAGAAVALCGALCYAELATRMPRAGGEVHYLTRVFGRMWGFLSGWVSLFVGFSAASAAAALGVVAYVGPWLPSAWTGHGRTALLAAALILATGAFHASGVRRCGRLQASLAGLVLAALTAFIAFGLAGSSGGTPGWLASNPAAEGGREIQAPGGGWWIAFLQVSFAYSGWNAAAYLAEEVRDARRTLPRALLGGTLVVGAVYVGMNVVFFRVIPAAEWGADIAVARIAAERLFGAPAAAAVSCLVALVIFASLSAMTAAGPRVYLAMGRDGLAPRFLARVDPRTAVPRAAVWTQAAVAAALALSGTFEALLVYIGSALLLFSGAAVAALLVVRGRERRAASPPTHRARGVPGDRPRRAPVDTAPVLRAPAFRVPAYPLVPCLYLASVVMAWGYGLRERPGPTLAALLTLAAGAVAWRVACRQWWSGAHRMSIPGEASRPSRPGLLERPISRDGVAP